MTWLVAAILFALGLHLAAIVVFVGGLFLSWALVPLGSTLYEESRLRRQEREKQKATILNMIDRAIEKPRGTARRRRKAAAE